MREKIDLWSAALFSVLFVLVLLEMALRALGIIHQVPVLHKDLLLLGFLLWFVSLVARRDRGDDWAGQV